MRNSFDYYKQVEKPNMYLCNPNQKPIGAVNAENRHLTLRFHDLSELTFTVPKIKGTERIYNRIETRRLIFVEQIGWFQITNVTDNVEGDYESKDVTCESHQTQLKTRGFISEERVYMFYNPNDPLDTLYDSSNVGAIPSIIGQLYQQIGLKVNLSIGDIEVDHDYIDWTIIYIDEALKFKSKSYGDLYFADDTADNICRTFSEETTFGYDFIVNKVEQAFEVVFEFDFLYHTIKVKRLEDITKPTNIYLSLDNLAESISVTENAENIITVLFCNGNDLDIRTVNPMGTNYIVNFDYYKKRTSADGTVSFPWMSERLIETLDNWQAVWEENKQGYSDIVAELQNQYLQQTDISKDIQFANLKLTDLQAARDQYTGKEDDGSGIIIVESVDVNDTSLSPTSSYNSAAFQENNTIQAYQNAPTMTKNSVGDYTTSFSGTARTGTAKSMLSGFVSADDRNDDGEWEAADGSTAYLYFSDDTNKKSYCKLRVASEIGVVKDTSGNIAKDGTVTVRDNTFSVTTSTDYFYVTPTGGTKISVSKSKSSFIYNGEQFKITQSADGITSVYCYYVAGFKRYSTYKTLVGANGWCTIWEKEVARLDTNNKASKDEIKSLTERMSVITERCNIQKYVKAAGDDLYNEFSNYWIEGEYSNDSIAALDSTTMDERIELAQELMAASAVELQKVSQPTFELSVSAVNFIKLIEFRTFTDQLELGRVITVERDDDTHYRPALTSIEYDLDESDTFNLTFSTAGKLDETEMTFADLLNESSSTSRTISANWSNLTDYWKNKDEITSLINAPLDRTLRATQANMANQEFTIDTTGILGRKWSDDSHTAFGKEQVRIVNNTIIFTNDNWETAKTALGKVYFDHYDADGNKSEAMGYGLCAEVLVGSLIMGENLQVRNSNNSILLDENGITIKKSNAKVFQATTDGDVYLEGTVYANAGQFGEITINTDGSIVSANGNFKVSAEGNLIAKGGGTIGGYTISNASLTSGNVGMSSDTTSGAYAFWAGNSTPSQAPFGVTNEGAITATYGDIGNLILESGNLYSQNFKIETLKNSSNTQTWVKFMDSDGNETTTISDTDISALRITATDSITTKDCTATTLLLDDGLKISGDSISGSTTSLTLDMKGESTSYSATLTYSNWDNYLKVTLNNNLRYTRTFYIRYKVVWGSSYSTASVTINAGQSSGQTTVSAFWGINDAYFSGYRSTSFSFTQYLSSGQIAVKGMLRPDGSYQLGTRDYPWEAVYAKEYYNQDGTSIISGSDKNIKNTISSVPETYGELFDLLRPVTYKLNAGKSGRTHLGLIAQEVKESMDSLQIDSKDFAAFCAWDTPAGSRTYGLRYTELIPLNIYEVQKLKKRVTELETELKELKEKN